MLWIVYLSFDILGTSAHKLWTSGAINEGNYVLNNISNLLRMIIMYKFGGTYLDNDSISLRKIEPFPFSIKTKPKSFVVAEALNSVNNAFLHFDETEHPINKCVMGVQVLSVDIILPLPLPGYQLTRMSFFSDSTFIG